MTRMASFSSLIPLLLFCLLFTPNSSSAQKQRVPGFLYTRTTGRCTPQYWSGRREAWPRMVPETSTVSKVFGSRVYERYRLDLTLLEATARDDEHDNPFGGLVKEATAALLNSYTRRESEGFPYRPWQVKTLFIQALVSEASAASLAKRFSLANQACF